MLDAPIFPDPLIIPPMAQRKHSIPGNDEEWESEDEANHAWLDDSFRCPPVSVFIIYSPSASAEVFRFNLNSVI